mmetsp:Transcript_14676/g.18151  ORF Transcript_14676/g.18151 Transcript_14676/m.18151 type:complete len:478 (-) Transcript_14676:820-2253(-)
MKLEEELQNLIRLQKQYEKKIKNTNGLRSHLQNINLSKYLLMSEDEGVDETDENAESFIQMENGLRIHRSKTNSQTSIPSHYRPRSNSSSSSSSGNSSSGSNVINYADDVDIVSVKDSKTGNETTFPCISSPNNNHKEKMKFRSIQKNTFPRTLRSDHNRKKSKIVNEAIPSAYGYGNSSGTDETRQFVTYSGAITMFSEIQHNRQLDGLQQYLRPNKFGRVVSMYSVADCRQRAAELALPPKPQKQEEKDNNNNMISDAEQILDAKGISLGQMTQTSSNGAVLQPTKEETTVQKPKGNAAHKNSSGTNIGNLWGKVIRAEYKGKVVRAVIVWQLYCSHEGITKVICFHSNGYHALVLGKMCRAWLVGVSTSSLASMQLIKTAEFSWDLEPNYTDEIFCSKIQESEMIRSKASSSLSEMKNNDEIINLCSDQEGGDSDIGMDTNTKYGKLAEKLNNLLKNDAYDSALFLYERVTGGL